MLGEEEARFLVEYVFLSSPEGGARLFGLKARSALTRAPFRKRAMALEFLLSLSVAAVVIALGLWLALAALLPLAAIAGFVSARGMGEAAIRAAALDCGAENARSLLRKARAFCPEGSAYTGRIQRLELSVDKLGGEAGMGR